MALVIPWLLVREYQQHRNLDYYGLPETFEEWREAANALADQLCSCDRSADCEGRYPPWRTRRVGAAAGASSERSGALRIREDGLACRSHLLKPSGCGRVKLPAVRDRSRVSAGWAVSSNHSCFAYFEAARAIATSTASPLVCHRNHSPSDWFSSTYDWTLSLPRKLHVSRAKLPLHGIAAGHLGRLLDMAWSRGDEPDTPMTGGKHELWPGDRAEGSSGSPVLWAVSH